MRILHTADWHLGQTLNGWPRVHEHRAFFAALADIVAAERVDALLVAGDVFDGINPSGEAQRMLYGAIAGLVRDNPGLQIVITSGNHDSAQRLEAPEPVMNALGVHVLGTLRRGADGVDMDRHLIALRDRAGAVRAHVLAVPFLRAADLPGLGAGFGAMAEGEGDGEGGGRAGAEPAITAAARALHAAMCAAAVARAGGLPLIAMGHLTCAGGLESEGAERRILIGGEHAVPPDLFPPALRYVALGHLHRPQSLAGGRVRYCGSPFPLSAAEIGYDHGVSLIDLDAAGADGALVARHIPLARPVAMHRIPPRGAASIEDAAAALAALGLDPDTAREAQPFVYLALLADRPVTQIAAQAEALMADTPARLAGQTITRPDAPGGPAPDAPPPSLAQTTPEDLFRAAWAQTHGTDPEPRHLAAFRDALAGV